MVLELFELGNKLRKDAAGRIGWNWRIDNKINVPQGEDGRRPGAVCGG